ncbi:MAG: purine-binding chemotaxis protein CheW [Planctomycetes bacterium]|nr:purine-binding chemotaxis protein CheW [Planctomycetota bacterium]
MSQVLGRDADNENKFLSFYLGNEEYGLEILRVREIIGIIDITPLPQTPDYVKGVINLRGKIIPVIELRSKFSMPSVAYTEQTCVIVVEVSEDDSTDQFQMGVIVDNVSEVLDIAREQIEPPPDFGCRINTDYILGMGKVKERVVILLDINKVMTESEIESLQSASTDSDMDKPSGESEPIAA